MLLFNQTSDLVYQDYRYRIRKPIVHLLFGFLLFANLGAQVFYPKPPNHDTRQSAIWRSLLDHSDVWFSSKEALAIADNVLLYQRNSGGWPKNLDMATPLSESEKNELSEYANEPLSTIDNGATYTQLYFLAKLIQSKPDQRYVLAFLKGLDYLLKAQYENGGWPQFYPLRKGYYSQITYNDDAMIGVLRLLKDIVEYPHAFYFVNTERKERTQLALDKGIDCILKTQVKVDNQLTVWCAQHDAMTLKPANARAYELISLSGKESVGILSFLMELENPSPEVILAIQSGVRWLEQVKLTGVRQERKVDKTSPTGFNKVVVHSPDAPAIWARFYTINSNKPFFSDRDGKMYDRIEDISSERRNEYGWLGYWPQNLLENKYPNWLDKWNISSFKND